MSCAAAAAVLDVIESENLQENALDVGSHLAAGLNAMADRYDCIGDVRGTGLFIALELVTRRQGKLPASGLADDVVNGLRDRGVLTSSIGPKENILKLRPPMVLTKQDADHMLGVLDATLAAVQ